MRPLRMARDLGFLPGGESALEFLERDGGLGLEPADLLATGHRVAGRCHGAQFLVLASSSATGFSKSR